MVFSMFKQPVNIKSIKIYFTDHSVQNQKWNHNSSSCMFRYDISILTMNSALDQDCARIAFRRSSRDVHWPSQDLPSVSSFVKQSLVFFTFLSFLSILFCFGICFCLINCFSFMTDAAVRSGLFSMDLIVHITIIRVNNFFKLTNFKIFVTTALSQHVSH